MKQTMAAGPRAFALLAAIVAIGLAGACVNWRGGLGEDCIKNDDCLSGICEQLRCAAAPPYLDAELTAIGSEGGGALDASPRGGDSSPDGAEGGGGPSDASVDASLRTDSSVDAGEAGAPGADAANGSETGAGG